MPDQQTLDRPDCQTDRQIELEELFNKNQLLPRIRREFADCPDFDFKAAIVAQGIPEEFGIGLLVQMALHKRTTLQTLVGCLKHHFKDSSKPCQDTADMILKCAEADLVDYNAGLKLFIVKFTISADVQEELDRFQFPLPMVVEPRPVRNNRETGYLTAKGSVILRDNHHDEDVCLDHINRVNQTKFTINTDTAAMVKNRWRNLDKPKEGETKEDFDKRRKAFEKYDRTSKEVIKLLTDEGDHFHLTHRYDKRGRIYCMGYHVSYQAAPWNKAVIELAEREYIE
jgi:hypothetical protein